MPIARAHLLGLALLAAAVTGCATEKAAPAPSDVPEEQIVEEPIPEIPEEVIVEEPIVTDDAPPDPPKTEEVKKPELRKSRWDPPADMAHLDATPPNDRLRIDELVKVMMDFDAGRDSLDAKERLIAIGKPAFPRVLGAMAKIRDEITDVDNLNERLLESSLKLADECLREMDGWLTAKSKSYLRPGAEKKYIAYICRLHYKRWTQVLKDMVEMPGPYDK